MVFCCIVLLYTLALRFGGLIVYHAFHGDDSLPCGLSFIMPRIQWTIVPQRIILHPSGIHCICKVNKILLLSGKTFLGLSVLVKIDLNLLFLRIIGYYRSFLVKISAFYNAYSLKLKTKPQDE